MQSEVQIDTGKAQKINRVLEHSLENNEKINYVLKSSSDLLTVRVETESLGQLRGCTDTVFRLATLSEKILDR